MISGFSHLEESMVWAMFQARSTTVADTDNAYGEHAGEEDRVEDLQDKVHQLYSVLTQVMKGENDIVCNSLVNGLEVLPLRRQLCVGGPRRVHGGTKSRSASPETERYFSLVRTSEPAPLDVAAAASPSGTHSTATQFDSVGKVHGHR